MTESPKTSASSYWIDARTPLSSLLFLIPWIVVYEFGILAVGTDHAEELRNGADYWMRSLLTRFGFAQLVLPLLVAAALLGWHLTKKIPWQFRMETQLGMLAESVLLAMVLIAVGQGHDLLFRALSATGHDTVVLTHAISQSVTRAVSFIGAGVYEEVMFRLLLVPATFLLFRLFEFPPNWAAAMAAVSTSFMFALAHHVGPAADPFNLFAFSFRTAAGLFFATVFLLRGFGITVGCHAAYDLLVGVLLAMPAD